MQYVLLGYLCHKAPSQQQAISNEILGASEVIPGFPILQNESVALMLTLLKGQLFFKSNHCLRNTVMGFVKF